MALAAVADWAEIAGGVSKMIGALGPIGGLVVSGVVGLGILVALLAHWHGLYGERRAGQQSLGFVDRLMTSVDKLAQRELELRAAMERMSRESESHMIRAVQLEADTDLMRMQLRRTIELLREIREGRLPPSAIKEADLIMEVATK